MTREEAVNILKWHQSDLSVYDSKVDEAIDMAIHELEIQEQKEKCRKCEHYRCGENIFPYCSINEDERKPFVCEFKERVRI